MIAALAFLLSCTGLGVLLSTRLRTKFALCERLALGTAAGLAIAMWLPIAAAIPLGVAGGAWAALAIVLVALAAEARLNSSWRASLEVEWREARRGLRSLDGVLLLAAFLLLALLFGQLFHSHYFEQKGDALYSGGYSWGDHAWHMTLANSFLIGGNFPPHYPVYAGWPLGYSFAPDFLAAAMAALGMQVSDALWVTAWLASLALLVLAYGLGRALIGGDKRWWALAAVLLFVVSGGLGFYYFFSNWASLGDANQALLKADYAHNFGLQDDLWYINITTAILLPVRGGAFGMALGVAALLLLVRAIGEGLRSRGELLGAGLLAGALPLVHAHSFLAVSFAAGCWLLLFRKRWKMWLWFFVPLALLALPQVIWMSQHLLASAEAQSPFLRIETGWMSQARGPLEWAWWWVKNAGPFILLAAAALFKAPPLLLRFCAPFVALFFIGNLIVFQPYDYDNVKLFAYVQLLCAFPAALLLSKLWERRGKVVKAAVLALLFLCMLSGALSLARETQLSWQIADSEAISFAAAVNANTPPAAIFLTASDHNHPVPMLAGRTILVGYKGWLWTHGISYAEREREVSEIYSGGAQAIELLRKEKVDYIVVGPPERREFQNLNEEFLRAHFKEVLRVGSYVLYKVAG